MGKWVVLLVVVLGLGIVLAGCTEEEPPAPVQDDTPSYEGPEAVEGEAEAGSTAKPAEGSERQQPAEGSEGQQPPEGSESQPPPEGSETRSAPEGSGAN